MKRRDSLIKALNVLVSGDSAGFEDVLWLTFGDEWTEILARLTSRDLVRYIQKNDTYYITPRGRASLIHTQNQRHNEPKQTA